MRTILIAALLFAVPTYAQIVVPDVVVTGSRYPQPRDRFGGSVEVIDLEESDTSTAQSLSEVLSGHSGIFAAPKGPAGANSSVFLRGGESHHVLVLVDGVEVNDPTSTSRGFDLSQIDLEDVARIEILRGPQSGVYGSDALSGVINIITKSGRSQPGSSLEVMAGSYGTYGFNTQHRRRSGRAWYGLGIGHEVADGISAADEDLAGNSEADGYRRFNAHAKGEAEISEVWSVEAGGRWNSLLSEIDDRGGAFGDDPDYEQKQSLATGYVLNQLKLGLWDVRHRLEYSQLERELNDPGELNAQYEGSTFKTLLGNVVHWSTESESSFGLEYERETAESTSNFAHLPHHDAETYSAFAQHDQSWELFFAGVSLRHDSHSEQIDFTTFRLSPGMHLGGWKFLSTYATAAKVPSLYQKWDPTYGNPDLHPETSWGAEAGAEKKWDHVSFEARYFYQEVKDQIDFYVIDPDSLTGEFRNVSRALKRGVESSVAVQVSPRWRALVALTAMDTDNAETGEDLLGRPDNFGRMTISYRHSDDWRHEAVAYYVGRKTDFGGEDTASYVRLDYKLTYYWAPSWQSYLRIENLLNEDYQTVAGYGAPGLSGYASIRYVWADQ